MILLNYMVSKSIKYLKEIKKPFLISCIDPLRRSSLDLRYTSHLVPPIYISLASHNKELITP